MTNTARGGPAGAVCPACWDKNLLSILPGEIREILLRLPDETAAGVEEIRLRQGGPLCVHCGGSGRFVSPGGQLTDIPSRALWVTETQVQRVFQNITKNSLYALEEELRNGYLTIPGGHRVGFTGEAILAGGKLRSLKNIANLNIRVSRQVIGCADAVMGELVGRARLVRHTLIISPPKCGKTTLLRDIVRQLSSGVPNLSFPGVNVALVDERSEVAACCMGVPQNDVGLRTDVLDRCPKAEGMYMLVRSMSPDVIATDELGRMEDIRAVEEVLNAGIKLVTTVHGLDLKDIRRRPAMRELLDWKMFERFIVLGRSRGAGTVESVFSGASV